MKKCSTCNQEKTHEDFHRRGKKSKRFFNECKSCHYSRTRLWMKNNPSVRKHIEWKANLRKLYGLSIEAYESMFKAQGGACKICGEQNLDGKRLFIDHDHSNGSIRGLLCNRCNRGLGYFRDKPTLLESAITYLNQYQSKEML